jgi:hypothetical protein
MPALSISQTPDPLNITVRQNQEWAITFSYQDSTGTIIPLTGYTPLLQLRTSALAKTSVLSVTSGAGLTFNATSLPQVQVSAAMNVDPGKYEWDLKLTPASGKDIFLGCGTIQVNAEVSR